MNIKDVAIFTNGHLNQSSSETIRSFPPIQNKLTIENDIFIEKLPRDESLKVFSACEPKGYNFDPVRQFGQLYSFVRVNAPESPPLKWDSDERLQMCIGLSRLIHPTTISFEYSCRIRYENNIILDIIPGPIADFGAKTWVAKEENRNWLTESEGRELSYLFQAYFNANLPKRIKGAIWYLEYAFRTYYIDLRWPIICIGLEYLIHTDLRKSTRQFSFRITRLAEELGFNGFNEDMAKEAYEMRSTLVHGQLIRDLEGFRLELYEEIERLLREVIKKAILEATFAEIFSSTDKIKERWPVR